MRQALFRLFPSTLVLALILSCSGGGGGAGSGGTGGGVTTGTGGKGGSGSGGAGSGGSGSGGVAAGTGGKAGTGGANADGGGNDAADAAGADTGGMGGASGGGMGQMFGSHKFQYPAGTIRPTGTAAALDAAVAAFYDKWKQRYVITDCGGRYILTGGGTGAIPGTVTVSEGQGYGMGIVPFMAGHDPNAQMVYDDLYRFFRRFGSINDPDLMAWSVQQGCQVPNGNGDLADSATDGDLDIAFSLVLADRQWGSNGTINYLGEAKKVITAIKTHEINPITNIVMMGDWADIKAPYYATRYANTDGPYGGGQPFMNFYYGTRPSDFMIDHFRAYASASGDTTWMAVVDAHHALVKKMQDSAAPNTGLLPDFIENVNTNPVPTGPNYLESEADGRVGYNSCRVPWHLATDYIASGDARAKAEVDKINRWIKAKTGSNPGEIRDGYGLDGSTAGASKVFAFEAPFGVAAIVDAANQAWLDAIWRDMVTNTPNTVSYYDDSIKLLSIIVMSGNWFAP